MRQESLLPEMQTESYLVGQIQAVFYENPANFYKVLLVKILETNTGFDENEIVVTGTFGQIQEEEQYRFVGRFVTHAKYGKQFQSERYQQEKPTSASGVIAYLSSDKFPGIGKKTAGNIVAALGENAIETIINDPESLAGIKGLNNQKRTLLLERLRENYGMEKIVVGLSQYGFSNQLAFAIYQVYKADTLDIVEENPYQLVEDIDGIGFKKADSLAEQLGIAADSPKRIRAAILHEVLHTALTTGDTYLEAKELLETALNTLEKSRPVEIHPDSVAQEIISLAEEGAIIQEGTRLYEKTLYFSEWGISSSIQRLLARKKEIFYADEDIEKSLRLIEKRFGIVYGNSQREAIKEALKSPLFILTGGPGTGKTTVINGIVSVFAELNGLSLDIADYTQDVFPISLAAPTGRAAKRMNETTGLPASTIHRLLGLTGREKDVLGETRELDGGLLIVDEMSMVDTWLANTLFKAVPTNMQVILVGDKDQLPSVGPGQVFTDLLAVADIPTCELTEIYRQEDGSSIIPLAHNIRNGQIPEDLLVNQADRSFIRCSAGQVASVVQQIVTRAKEKGFTAQDMQVLAPMYRGIAGIDALNQLMQEILNSNDDGRRKEVQWLDKTYRIGDKVLHLVNSPETNVFNGDIGEITGITLAKDTEDKIDELTLLFDDTEITYKRNEWQKITLAYCCSIHKAQGSEFKMVILPMLKQYSRMLQRKLLYTGVTRSKELLILIGEPEAFAAAIANQSINRRTGLVEKIVHPDRLSAETLEQMDQLNRKQKEAAVSAFDEPPSAAESAERPSDAKQGSLFSEDIASQEPKEYRLTAALVHAGTIDPLIGMNGASPYDFA